MNKILSSDNPESFVEQLPVPGTRRFPVDEVADA